MNFAAIPSGTAVFVDANVFIYWLAPDPTYAAPCERLIERIENRELVGVTSSAEFSDVAHRLMTLEACTTFNWPYAGIAARLRRNPDEIKKLVNFRLALDKIARVGIRILDITGADVTIAADLSLRHGLLSGDALIVAVMQKHTLTYLASNDADFDRVPGIVRYSPF